MLEHLKKTFGLVEASADSEQNLDQLIDEQLTLVRANTALTEQVATLSAELSATKSELASLKTSNEDSLKQAALAKTESRLAQLTVAIGTEKAPAMLSALEGLADEQFNAVVSSMEVSLESESNTPEFKEQGVGAAPSLEAVKNKPKHFKKYS